MPPTSTSGQVTQMIESLEQQYTKLDALWKRFSDTSVTGPIQDQDALSKVREYIAQARKAIHDAQEVAEQKFMS